MSGRSLKPKTITDIDRFKADAEAIHQTMMGYQRGLRTGHGHYRAMERLHEALKAAVLEITGENELPWVRLGTAEQHPGHPIIRTKTSVGSGDGPNQHRL